MTFKLYSLGYAVAVLLYTEAFHFNLQSGSGKAAGQATASGQPRRPQGAAVPCIQGLGPPPYRHRLLTEKHRPPAKKQPSLPIETAVQYCIFISQT